MPLLSSQPTFVDPRYPLLPNLPHREKFISDYYLGIRMDPDSVSSTPLEEDESPLDFHSLIKDAPRIPNYGATPSFNPKLSNPPSSGPATSPNSMDSLFPEDFLAGLPVPNRLASCVDFWRDTLHAPPDVLNNIVNGWPIDPLEIKPPPVKHTWHQPKIHARRAALHVGLRPCSCSEGDRKNGRLSA